jgi:hypothetical protein
MALSTTVKRTISQIQRYALGAVGLLSALSLADPAAAERANVQIDANRLPNGVYLYGESTTPDTIGKEYIVFETHNSQTIGAIYLPHSEFSCFQGNFTGNRMSISLVDAYDRQVYKYKFSLGTNTLTASNQPMMGSPTYQLVNKVSDNDRRMLNTCKTELSN